MNSKYHCASVAFLLLSLEIGLACAQMATGTGEMTMFKHLRLRNISPSAHIAALRRLEPIVMDKIIVCLRAGMNQDLTLLHPILVRAWPFLCLVLVANPITDTHYPSH